MNHRTRPGRQQSLCARLPRVQLAPELRQAVLPALAELIAAVLRRLPSPPAGGPHESA